MLFKQFKTKCSINNFEFKNKKCQLYNRIKFEISKSIKSLAYTQLKKYYGTDLMNLKVI